MKLVLYQNRILIFGSIISEASTTIFYSEKLDSEKYPVVYGSIGTVSQDMGRFPPDQIFILVANEAYIFMIQKPLAAPIKENIQCQTIYDSIFTNAEKFYATYQSSDLIDEAALQKYLELEETAWRKYCECYRKNFNADAQFNEVFQQIEKAIRDFENQK